MSAPYRCPECGLKENNYHSDECSRYPHILRRPNMIYLSGCVRPEVMKRLDLGLMLTPNMGNAPDLQATLWAADTGCFSKAEAFDLNAYLQWLRVRRNVRNGCLFATAPDVVGDAEATLALLGAAHDIRQLGYRAALVAQDGLEKLRVPWDEFDALFIGGSTAWKLSEHAFALIKEADDRGKWVHMGRVNSYKRLKAAAIGGCDSADGTFLAFGPDANLPRLEKWLETLRREGLPS